MKKVFIASFMAIIMLMVPIASVAQTQNVEALTEIRTLNTNAPEIVITVEDKVEIDSFIKSHFNIDLQDDAYSIVNTIINPDLQLDPIALADAIIEYGYTPIPEERLTIDMTRSELDQLLEEYWGFVDGAFVTNIFGDLINKIIDIIRGRLGWTYTLFTDGVYLFQEGVRLVTDFIELPIAVIVAFIAVVNQILTIPDLVSNLVSLLLSLEFSQFMDTLLAFIDEMGGNFAELIDSARQLFSDFASLATYLGEIQSFITWLTDEPWKGAILVTGLVKKNLMPLSGATITCRGQTATTDSNGEFSFYVDVVPSDDSLPPNQYYGMHNCAITVSHNGEVLKETRALLSYVFSSGEISWNFNIWKSRSRIIDFIFERLQALFSNFFIKNNLNPFFCN